jgi:hypothetical protein
VLGAYTKSHGTKGSVVISRTNLTLAAAMGVGVADLVTTVSRLPHVNVALNGHDDFTVTWHNWIKYQEDTTQADRQRESRAKKRREERRIRREENPPTNTPQTAEHPIPPSIVSALGRAPTLGAVPRLNEPKFWQATIRATQARVEYAAELLKAEAWLMANPTRAPRKDLARFVHNWMLRAGERP